MWELDYKESWAPKNWCFWTVVLEKTLESPLDIKEIRLVNPRGNQPWVFIGRTDAEAKAPILWPPNAKSWLTGKDPDAGKDSGQNEKGVTEDEMVGWHHCSMDMNLSKFQEIVKDREGWHAAVHGIAKSRTQLSKWTSANISMIRLRADEWAPMRSQSTFHLSSWHMDIQHSPASPVACLAVGWPHDLTQPNGQWAEW